MQAISSTISGNNWQTARPVEPSVVAWPDHVIRFLTYLESKQFSHPADFEGLEPMQIENIGRVIAPLTPSQTRELCHELWKRYGGDWMPDGKKITEAISDLWPSVPGHVAESRRTVAEVLPETNPGRLLPPVTGRETGRERFKRMQEECSKRGQPFNLAGAMQAMGGFGSVSEREQKRKAIQKQIDKEWDAGMTSDEYYTRCMELLQGEQQPEIEGI